ncbi:MAG TPA: pyruvate carboxylase subunit B [Dehalococcoidales bacterium]|nr:pyruvate carboxylase subunit B [Dehalococcoidales bacterium]
MTKSARKDSLKVTDVTLRDGQQSILAARLRTSDILKVAREMDRAGFHSLEVWGGATIDVALQFHKEDPWDRPRMLKKLMPDTPLQMLLRGQNLVGYTNYADDVVSAFIHHAAGVGIDIFRVFDALNDERNILTALQAIKECGKHAQLAICYSLTGPKMGGPIYNLDYYANKAIVLQNMGADSICIKDMAGILAPDDAYTLIKALKGVIKVPIHLHSHCTSGMASATYFKAIEAGVDGVDTALAPLALRSSVPAIEPIVTALTGTESEVNIDLAYLNQLDEQIEYISRPYLEYLDSTRISTIDARVILHQIPGGMISSLMAQLREIDALDKLPEVYKEIQLVRAELGYPPLVTPTSQFIVAQAVQNVLLGRYKLILSQIMDYCYGLYGKPPVPIDPEVLKIALKHYKRGKEPITCRPADIIPPEMDKARASVEGMTRETGDILISALFPNAGRRFLKERYQQAGSTGPQKGHHVSS